MARAICYMQKSIYITVQTEIAFLYEAYPSSVSCVVTGLNCRETTTGTQAWWSQWQWGMGIWEHPQFQEMQQKREIHCKLDSVLETKEQPQQLCQPDDWILFHIPRCRLVKSEDKEKKVGGLSFFPLGF